MEYEMSVVIPTYNRSRLLRRVLDCLSAQSMGRDRFEVVVVDDGSDDDTAAMLETVKASGSLALQTVLQERKLGGSARNAGIRHAKGRIVFLMDSDILTEPDFLEKHAAWHRRCPDETVVVMGRRVTGSTGVDLLDPDEDTVPASVGTVDGLPLIDVSGFVTGNISMKRSFLVRAGMFTPGLPCLQDMDLAFRMQELGMKLVYRGDAVGTHLGPLDTVDKVIFSGAKYGRALAEWYDRIPGLRREITRLGGRFDGGWAQFRASPWRYVKDAVRRLIVNRATAPAIERCAHAMPVTVPPRRSLVRLCKELWAYHYRYEFNKGRQKLRKAEAEGRPGLT